jgi:hypothetical protein
MYLWVDSSGRLIAHRIRDIIARHFIEYFGINLTISMYRHVAIAFMEKHIKTYVVDVAYSLQAGKNITVTFQDTLWRRP